MNIRPTKMNPLPTGARLNEHAEHAEQAIQVYLDWLNLWHEGEGDECRVTRADCDEYDAPPFLINDFMSLDDMHTLTIWVSPYHDEGGPTILTAFFTNYCDPDDWDLACIDQCFDTMHQYIFNDGKLTNIPDDSTNTETEEN